MRVPKIIYFFFFFALSLVCGTTYAQTQEINIDVSQLERRAAIFFSPRSGSFVEGSPFDVSVFVDTKGGSINAVDLTIKFDPEKLSVIKTLGGRSVVGIWLEQPSYSNTSGIIHLSGAIPNGIKSDGALIATIAFKPILGGVANLTISDTSQILANDGLGSAVLYESERGRYEIVPQPPGSVKVFSDTHPFRDRWYNNNSPSFAWEGESGVTEYSYVLDDKPSTIPDSSLVSNDTVKGYENLPDSVWYFHIKARKRGVWGATTHFPVRIDTAPPAKFTPTIDVLSAAVIQSRGLVSFFTTDALSGVDHYEVGVIGANDSPDASPAYVEAQSPYQLPGYLTGKSRVVVRAFDRAGNITSGTGETSPEDFINRLMKNKILIISLGFLLALLIIFFFSLYMRHWIKKLISHISNVATRHEEGKIKEIPITKPTPIPSITLSPPEIIPSAPTQSPEITTPSTPPQINEQPKS